MANIPDHRSKKYVKGDHLVLCQRTGRVVYASDCKREWNGLLVHKSVWEPKHPQLMVRSVPDKQHTYPVIPEPALTYIASDYVLPDYWEIAYTGMS